LLFCPASYGGCCGCRQNCNAVRIWHPASVNAWLRVFNHQVGSFGRGWLYDRTGAMTSYG
jgi:hypothetical protein